MSAFTAIVAVDAAHPLTLVTAIGSKLGLEHTALGL
jgi:hypothetical protein